jgi:hypothetical protein
VQLLHQDGFLVMTLTNLRDRPIRNKFNITLNTLVYTYIYVLFVKIYVNICLYYYYVATVYDRKTLSYPRKVANSEY